MFLDKVNLNPFVNGILVILKLRRFEIKTS